MENTVKIGDRFDYDFGDETFSFPVETVVFNNHPPQTYKDLRGICIVVGLGETSQEGRLAKTVAMKAEA